MYEGILEFQDGTLVSKAKVNVNGTIYDVEPEQYSGSTPLSAANLNKMQKKIYDGMFDLFYPIGTYYETNDKDFNPNKAWRGTWISDNDGTVLVSRSNEETSVFNIDIGSIFGEEKHVLTVKEMPEHRHVVNITNNNMNGTVGYARVGDWTNNGKSLPTEYTGDNESHNNVQPSKIVNRWLRIA